MRCFDNHGRHFIVEMQLQWTPDLIKRILFNSAATYILNAQDCKTSYQAQTVQATRDGIPLDRIKFESAADKARNAVLLFQRAAVAGISDGEKKALTQAGELKLQQAQAIAGERGRHAYNFKCAADEASSAADFFQRAAVAGTSDGEKKALTQAGELKLQQAQATAEERISDANNFDSAVQIASNAVGYFKDAAAAEIFPEEKEAWTQTGEYNLLRSGAIVERSKNEANNFKLAAEAAFYAASYFKNAAAAGISLEQKEAWTQAGRYKLQHSRAIVEGIKNDAENLKWASGRASNAASFFKKAAMPEISETEKNDYLQQGNYRLRDAELWATDNRERAKNFTFEEYQKERTAEANKEWYAKNRELGRPSVWRGI